MQNGLFFFLKVTIELTRQTRDRFGELKKDRVAGVMRTDPLQGECYHISKTKDAVSGGRAQRFAEMYNTVPITDVPSPGTSSIYVIRSFNLPLILGPFMGYSSRSPE